MGTVTTDDGTVIFFKDWGPRETDFTEDLKQIEVPVLVMHGTDDQVVPYEDSGPLSAKLIKNSKLKSYEGYPHGMLTVHADVLNPDILEFIES